MINPLKIISFAFLLMVITVTVRAQKLSNIQENGFRAPANVKIDGKINEWGDALQAYNKAASIYYTMANDDKNLYFIMKSTDQVINNKFLAGGIDITINTTGKKKEKDAYVVEYPLVDMANIRRQVGAMRTANANKARRPNDEAMTGMDSIAIATRRKLLNGIKEIKLTGFTKDVADSVISVYNQFGIKTGIDYDNQGNLTCEVAIPLKYLHLSGSDFAYNIKLNGLNMMAFRAPEMNSGNNIDRARTQAVAPPNYNANPSPDASRQMNDMQIIISPTDFWGKYTLVKK
jgi:hypothetical protein